MRAHSIKKSIIAILIVAVVGILGFFGVKYLTDKRKEPVNEHQPQSQAQSQTQMQSLPQLSTQTAQLTSQPQSTTQTKTETSDPSVSQQSRAQQSNLTDSAVEQDKKVNSFNAHVVSTDANDYEVEIISESNGIPKGSKVKVSVDKKHLYDNNGKTVRADDFVNFKKAQVIYTGDILKTSPLSVNADKVILSQREKCSVYFYIDGKNIKTLTVSVGASLDSSDMPNASAYCQDGYHSDGWQDESGKTVYSFENITESVVLSAKISHD